MSMFCYQCEQTAGGKGCQAVGVCGKDSDTAALQDLLVHAAKGFSIYAHRLAQANVRRPQWNHFIADALFTTVTNVNFDPARMEQELRTAAKLLNEARSEYQRLPNAAPVGSAASWIPAPSLSGLVQQGSEVSITTRTTQLGADIAGLQELLVYGLKGTAAYAVHARLLGKESQSVYDFFFEALELLTQPQQSVDTLLKYCLRCGEVNLQVMELLDAGHNDCFGQPVPTAVRITPKKGKAILVSGHDLAELEELLKQTAGKGINVYTHGEMLPAHGYPKLKAYPHLAGNYGGAWQNQAVEFNAFPGAILMTTNCIQKPLPSYKNRIFTSGLVAWPGVAHCRGHDFTPVINAALAAPGFDADGPEQTITVGFGHKTVLGVADQAIAGVKSGAIKHFFLIGGCDGAKPGRDYYTEFAQSVPQDCLILTLACGKYRFNKLDFGTIGGLPRLLDVGQCNDAYSAIKIAAGLAQAFNCSVNDLPLSLIISWYEQKAVCILLTLLHLGIKNIRIGPSLPAFVTPAVLKVLVDSFSLRPIGSPAEDLQACLSRSAH